MKKFCMIILSIILLSGSLFAVEETPQHKVTYYIRRAIRADNNQEKVEFYKKGLEVYPNHLTIVALLASTYVSIGEMSQANSLYDAAIMDTEDNQAKDLILAQKYKFNGDFPSAIKVLTNLLGQPLSSKEPRAWLLYFRGECYFLNKDYEKALIDLTESIDIKPEMLVYEQRAEVYNSLGMNDLADKDRHAAKIGYDAVIKR